MEFQGEEVMEASLPKMWELVSNPVSLAGCFPGLQKVEHLDTRRFNATVLLGVSFVKGSFDFQFEIAEKEEPSRMLLNGVGKGVGSIIDLRLTVELAEVDAKSRISWHADVAFKGLLAGVGENLIRKGVEANVNKFFECLAKLR